ASMHQAVAIQHRVHGAVGREVRAGVLLAQFFAELRRAPPRILPLESDDGRLDRRRQPIRLAMRSPAAIIEGANPAVLVPVEDLVAGLARDPNSTHRGAIFSPSSRRATNRSRSSMT